MSKIEFIRSSSGDRTDFLMAINLHFSINKMTFFLLRFTISSACVIKVARDCKRIACLKKSKFLKVEIIQVVINLKTT